MTRELSRENFSEKELWLVAGSQHLYGEEALKEVRSNAGKIAEFIDSQEQVPLTVKYQGTLTTSAEIASLMRQANSAENCIGLIVWMHTFSPARMWIKGLRALQKPFVHLHTQYRREIPWGEIDMDYMNINQSAHGGREFGYICTRLGLNRKVIVGHWQEEEVLDELGVWSRAALAWHDSQEAEIARFGDNMRRVAVTEGDKVEAQIKLGYAVNGFGLGDLVEYVNKISPEEIDSQLKVYQQNYNLAPELQPDGSKHDSLREEARVELGMRRFLEEGGFKGFTTNFQTLHGLKQLPGLAVQRLMASGYGFGAEGDWKTAALVRAMKVMAAGLSGGNSFMEQYTYHLEPGRYQVLGAHMLEVCPTLTTEKPSVEVHPLDIGGKADPVRAIFTADTGPAVNASLIDLGDHFRLIVNEVETVSPENELKKLPVARMIWRPQPDFKTAITAWILAGGAHHTGYSRALKTSHLREFARLADVEYLEITADSSLPELEREIERIRMR